MRRGWKVFWIIIVILTGVGITLCVAAMALGISASQLREIYPDGIGFLSRMHTEQVDLPEHVRSQNEGEVSAFQNITSLEVEIGGYKLDMIPSTEKEVRVDTTECWFGGDTEIAVYEEEGRLYIKTIQNGEFLDVFSFFSEKGEDYGTVSIFLPESLWLTEADIAVGASEVEINALRADKMKLSIGAADCHIDYLETNSADIMVGGGDLEIEGKIEGDVIVKCGAGDIEIKLQGNEKDYNYELVCGAGSIEINEKEYGGAVNMKKIDNGSSRTIDVKCGAGDIEISFDKEETGWNRNVYTVQK